MKLEDIALAEGKVEFRGQTLNFTMRLPSFRETAELLQSAPETDTLENQLEWLNREKTWLAEHIVDWDLEESGRRLEVSVEVIERLPSTLVHALFGAAMEVLQQDQAPLTTSSPSDGG